jgi:hypothetical protein
LKPGVAVAVSSRVLSGAALASILVLAAVQPAPSAPVLVTAEGEPLAPPVEVTPAIPSLGVSFEVGAPDGAALSVWFAPQGWLRLGLGALTHLGGAGFRVSVALVPFGSMVRPLLAIDYGHYFPGDFRWMLSPDAPAAVKSVLSVVQYDFFNAQLGLEVGSPRVRLGLRAGISVVAGALGSFEQAAGAASVSATQPRFTAVIPSGKLALTWFFF